jgi:hypothetical protein
MFNTVLDDVGEDGVRENQAGLLIEDTGITVLG